jgi:plasmid stability protein
MSNLTLSIDDDLLKKARLYAVAHDTSVNAMVREYLREIAERSEADRTVIESTATPEERRAALIALDELATMFRRENRIKTDWQWNRDDIYDERLERWNKQ